MRDPEGSEGTIHPSAQVEDGVRVEPGAVVGARVEIGRGTVVTAGAIVGEGVAIGRDCFIGANAVLQHALIGNRAIIHAGAAIGRDASGFDRGLAKGGRIGRVIIQDDVEIGANAAIDRGIDGDTVVGEGTNIDNQVQIAHNAAIGRHCTIAARAGISASVRVGDGAEVAAERLVREDVAPGDRFGGERGAADEGVVSRDGRTA